ncbi:MAG: PEGA domain-containing protein [Planctomycetes bacterium]|nr:PEGA domain-containing protein [Planctomycetota bacterium]
MAVGSSCATIVNGDTQSIPVSSEPTGATVTVDGEARGTTPCELELSRDRPHVLRISHADRPTAVVELERHISGWVWLNLLTLNMIGVLVDEASGGSYYLEPDTVHVDLRRTDDPRGEP